MRAFVGIGSSLNTENFAQSHAPRVPASLHLVSPPRVAESGGRSARILRASLGLLLGALLLMFSSTSMPRKRPPGFHWPRLSVRRALYSQGLSDYPRDGSSANAAFRAIVYPTFKLNSRWALNGAVEAYSFPYFYEDFATQNRGIKVELLQANLSYSRFWNDRSLVIRVGQMTSAFGSFLLRYDDATNPLVDVPMSYGYYLKGVTTNGLAGAEVDTTLGKVDLRLQFTNSSPANPRGLFATEQYGTWTWGGGYTIMQGLRIGASAYRGPYLDRNYPYYFPGELPPGQLPERPRSESTSRAGPRAAQHIWRMAVLPHGLSRHPHL